MPIDPDAHRWPSPLHRSTFRKIACHAQDCARLRNGISIECRFGLAHRRPSSGADMRNPWKAKLASENLEYRPILGTASAKNIKGQKLGYLTAIVYLVPDQKICSMAKLAGCFEACLKSAGRGAFRKIQQQRQAKTDLFKTNERHFMLCLFADIWSLIRSAKKRAMVPLVRLNGTSDICYENIVIDGKTVFQWFSDVQFYDYSKHPSRKLDGKTAGNYDLTYSFSGITPIAITHKGLLNPANKRVAVVFHKRSEIPDTFRGWPVIDGDNTDVRHIEPQAVVVALYSKGKAKRDYSGFVQHAGKDY